MAQVPFTDFLLGGLADSEFYGGKNSMSEIVGLDLHSQPGKVMVNQKLTKDSPDSGDNEVDEFCKVGLPLSDGSTLWFSSTSGKVWREVSGTWTLLGAIEFPDWDLRTAMANGDTYETSEVSGAQAMFWKPDGTKFYIMDSPDGSDDTFIYQYSCSTAWDVTTASYDSKSFSIKTQNVFGTAFFIQSDGTKMYAISLNGNVYRYSMSSAWDISTCTYDSNTKDISAQDEGMKAVFFKPDGTEMYAMGYDNNGVYRYTLSSAWDLSTASYVSTFDASTQVDFCTGMYFNSDGDKMFLADNTSDTIHSYTLSTAWDTSTATYDNVSFAANLGGVAGGLSFKPDGTMMFFSSTSAPETVYAYELSTEDLSVNVLSAEEYNSRVYAATKSRLISIAVADVADFVTGFITSGEFTNEDDTYHPMKKLNGNLYIGDAHFVAVVDDSGTFTADGLDIVEPLRISALGAYDVELLIGTFVNQNIMETEFLRWNTWSTSWQYSDPIPEPGVNSFLITDNEVVVSAGFKGHIYTYNGLQLTSKKRLPSSFNRGSSDKCIINDYSTLNFQGLPLFGVSQVVGNAIKYGIYSYGRRSAGYAYIFALEYVMSPDTMENVEIGAIVGSGDVFLVAWKSGSTFGVDRLDASAKYENAYMATRWIIADRRTQLSFGQCDVAYDTIPEGTDIDIEFKANAETDFTAQESVLDTERMLKSTTASLGDAVRGMLKIPFTVNGNEAPTMESFYVDVGE